MAKEYAIDFYNSREWKRCREGYILSVNGLCERCKAKGIITPGYIVHHKNHITPDNINNPKITLSWNNLEYLCQDCHNKEHKSEEILRQGLYFDDEGNLVQT